MFAQIFLPVVIIAFLFNVQRVHLDIHVGEQTMDYAGIAQKEKLTELQLRVRQLLAQVEQNNKEQNYQRVSTLLMQFPHLPF